jgi:hypothetical protein
MSVLLQAESANALARTSDETRINLALCMAAPSQLNDKEFKKRRALHRLSAKLS